MLTNLISSHIHLSESEKKEIENVLEFHFFSKNTTLLKESVYAKGLYILESGFVRSFYLTNEGNEKTHWIYKKEDIFTSWYSFFSNKPSFESIETISDSKIYFLSLKNYQSLYEKNEAFNAFINGYYQNFIAEMDFLSKTFINFSAKEKYEYLLNDSPELIQNVKLGQLASLLGISQETLSRVRRQM